MNRQDTIDHERNYCVHYGRGEGAGAPMKCSAGMDLNAVQCVPTNGSKIKFGPCIGGHTLEHPLAHCPKWERRSLQHAEKVADDFERHFRNIQIVFKALKGWRTWTPSNRVAKQEVIECPACKGRLHLSQAAYNGHVHGHCETPDCVSWME